MIGMNRLFGIENEVDIMRPQFAEKVDRISIPPSQAGIAQQSAIKTNPH